MSRNEYIRRLKMQDLERSARRSHAADPQAWRDTAWQASDYLLEQPRRGRNTLGPQEDVMEERRIRRQRVVGTDGATVRRGGVGESIFVLLALVASVAAVYWFCMQQLSQ